MKKLLLAFFRLLPDAGSGPCGRVPAGEVRPVPGRRGGCDDRRHDGEGAGQARAGGCRRRLVLLVPADGRLLRRQRRRAQAARRQLRLGQGQWSPQNRNVALLSRWPRIEGYPHLFVLDGSGRLLHSQNTGRLEDTEGERYEKSKFLAFLRDHRPAGRGRRALIAARPATAIRAGGPAPIADWRTAASPKPSGRRTATRCPADTG